MLELGAGLDNVFDLFTLRVAYMGYRQEECSLVPDRCLKYLRQLHTQRFCSQLQSEKKF
jgi:hypothetical protein